MLDPQDPRDVPGLSPEQEIEPIFEFGGPVYRLMQRIGVIKGMGPSVGRRFMVVRQMSVFPVGRAQPLQVAIVACLPGLPLVLLVLPFAEVLSLIAGVVS